MHLTGLWKTVLLSIKLGSGLLTQNAHGHVETVAVQKEGAIGSSIDSRIDSGRFSS